MATLLVLAVGGTLGTLTRYGVDATIERRSFAVFPWSTFVINISGCFLVGLLIALVVDRHHTPDWLRLGLIVGFCGAYTTFSTFAQESLDLVQERDVLLAVLNATASVSVGMVAVLLGQRVGRL
jgi:CrcB protein